MTTSFEQNNNLTRLIEQVIQSTVAKYIERVVKEFSDLDKKELELLWDVTLTELKPESGINVTMNKSNSVKTTKSNPKTLDSTQKPTNTQTQNSPSPNTLTGCQYIF